MNDDELKKLWQQQPLRDPAVSAAQLVSAMQSKTTQLRRTLLARDVRELLACVIVGVIFAIYFFTNRAPIARLGALITVAGSIFIAWKILHARRTSPAAKPDATVVESLRAELHSVRTQSQLLRSVLWWYLLPLAVGTLVFVWGMPFDNLVFDLVFKIGFTLVTLALDVRIYRLNQRARSKQLLPVEAQLQSLLHSAETGEPLDETHVANLRPIVLSMAAAERVKPVEFKVAFWQIAIYGEIGFVGIWFFLILGLEGDRIFRDLSRGSIHFVSQVFSWQHLLLIVPFFLAGLLYSWLLQKLTKRAVGISTLGVHLHKGQNLFLWDEIKEVRPFRLLNIRSLWLIRESGEKTIMPWTSLERHSDLKAAVEGFAPANHPIRKYLSLLKPEPPKKNIMTKTILIGIVLISLGAIVFVRGNGPKAPEIEYSDPVSQMLEIIREKHDLPALAAAVVVDGKIVVTSAVGFRKNGGPEKVTVDDKFHLGSVTKSMTATVAAMLVEQGKISWTTTIGEAFPELKSEIHPDYLGVTLEQLLSHRGGAPGDAPGDLWRQAWAAKGTAAEQRLAFIKGILARQPEAKPGTKHIYSNQGYTIAGVMLEKATGKTWEDLLRSMLFEPLGMTTAGFGAPASVDKVDQPWGHTKKMFSGSEPVPPGPGADNPLAISPAGAVHCSMGDLAKYAAFHMAGERGESELLTAESFKKLHTAVADNHDYALGWKVLKRPWANGRALMHNGSNTMFYVVVWMAPEKNCAVIVASNIGVDEAFQGCDEAAGKLIDQYFGK
jgi:CubicO group peptidase (beta-lactamase class C family)